MSSTMTKMYENNMLSSIPFLKEDQIHAKNRKNAIVMFSGGVDSTVALWWALDNYESVRVLTIDYNQSHIIEVYNANNIARMVGVEHQNIKVDFPASFWGIENHLTRGQACLMTSLAALDISHDGADIVLGILATDMYGDCSRDFLDSLANVLYHVDDWNSIGIATPLRAVKDKADVIALGYQYGAPISLTWTCRIPNHGKPCHNCIQCKQRDMAFSHFFSRYNVNLHEYTKWSKVFGSPYHPYYKSISHDLRVITEAFMQAGAFKRGNDCYQYKAPDGTTRISTHIQSIAGLEISQTCSIKKAITVHGYFDDHYRWEICICADGSVATTDRLPDLNIIEKALIKKAEI